MGGATIRRRVIGPAAPGWAVVVVVLVFQRRLTYPESSITTTFLKERRSRPEERTNSRFIL
jgi:hypothetical protein